MPMGTSPGASPTKGGGTGGTVWVTGAAGLIGRRIMANAAACAPGWRVIGLTRAELDLEDDAAVVRRFREDAPSVVIHCAGLTRSPACEADPEAAWRANVEVTARLAGLAQGGRLLFFSTDLVFDGTRGMYREEDAVNPLGVYGRSKAEAEVQALRRPAHRVLRTSLNYGESATGDRAFNEELVRQWRAGRVPGLFVDEYRCPIGAEVTARIAWRLALATDSALGIGGGEPAARIFHVAGTERLSRLEIGRLIAALHPELNPGMTAGSLKDYRGGPRPADTSLDCRKVERVLGLSLPRFSEWLAAGAGPDAWNG